MGSPRSDQVRTWLGEAGAWLGEAGDWRGGAREWRGGGELLNGRRREEGEGRRTQGRV